MAHEMKLISSIDSLVFLLTQRCNHTQIAHYCDYSEENLRERKKREGMENITLLSADGTMEFEINKAR